MTLPNLLERRRTRMFGVAGVVITAIVGVNSWLAVPMVNRLAHNHTVGSAQYKAQYGHWDTIDLPAKLRVNAIHATLLNTGKVLITAGSGNDLGQFKAGTFKTLIFDPVSGKSHLVYTPSDLFCGGQAYLSNGDVLIAGGTSQYEVLANKITHAGGVMTVKNESPDAGIRVIPIGTEFIGSNGQKYRTDADLIVQPAAKIETGHTVSVVASQTSVWVNAEAPGPVGNLNVTKATQFSITGLTGADARNIYGLATQMTMKQQDFHGASFSYVFDPRSEEYSRTADLTTKRWYPTLTPLSDGSVLAVSGLNGNGQIVNGTNETEQFDPATSTWVSRPDLTHYFPTYPALFQTAQKDELFYSSSNSGYGPGDQGRQPGFWNIVTNAFTPVPGLRDPQDNETSSSAWVGPIQNQTIAVVGGGGVGESSASTPRIDTIKLNAVEPSFTAGPSLPKGTRYPQLVTLPDDTTLITGGSQYYRGEHDSDNHVARIYHPESNTLTYAADPTVGRDYHSAALLLPDGRVITMGGNPLYADKQDTRAAAFEQRLSIFTPAYLYQVGPRPGITAAPSQAGLGTSMAVRATEPDSVATARLIRPGSTTHELNLEQRSVALAVTHEADGSLALQVPADPAIVAPGSYMLFLVNAAGVPSVATWVHITA
jgi:hypothetical protein